LCPSAAIVTVRRICKKTSRAALDRPAPTPGNGAVNLQTLFRAANGYPEKQRRIDAPESGRTKRKGSARKALQL